jgi:hypothetical protein
MSRVIELPARGPGAVRTPPGYRLCWRECSSCHRDFAVTVPVEPLPLGGLTVDIPCPHCHRHREELLVALSSRPIYVEAVRRTWIDWQVRHSRRLLTMVSVIVRVRLRHIGRLLLGFRSQSGR